MAEIETSTTLEEWKDRLDMRGVSIPLDEFEAAIESAPAAIRDTADFRFFEGFLYGRLIGEGVL